MTYRELVEYLRTKSVRCRSFADTATDTEAAQALREIAEELETVSLTLEAAQTPANQKKRPAGTEVTTSRSPKLVRLRAR